jgi:hypothetical protein
LSPPALLLLLPEAPPRLEGFWRLWWAPEPCLGELDGFAMA